VRNAAPRSVGRFRHTLNNIAAAKQEFLHFFHELAAADGHFSKASFSSFVLTVQLIPS
jgi:hypothetical protein